MAGQRMYFDPSKARRVLGFEARPWQEGVREAIAWFREARMLAP
jgi:dihydroflavonol-4-reductase